jgi:CheY-like chemotaxis protein
MSSVALVVDDDMLNRITVNHMLSKAGYSVQLAANGKEAISLLDNGLQPDVILTDIEMPVMNGRQLLAALRERSGQRDVPVIALTAHSPSMPSAESTTGSFNALVEKPIEKAELLETLSRVLSEKCCTAG